MPAPLTVKATLDDALGRFPGRPWLAFKGEVLTFSDLGRAVERLERALLGLGVGPGSRVALYLGNRPEWLELEYAALALGATELPVNTMLAPAELAFVLSHSGADVLVWGDRIAGRDTLGTLDELLPELAAAEPGGWRSERFPALRAVVGLGEASFPRGVVGFDELLAGTDAVDPAELAALEARVSPDDAALLLYTSGTTGTPKGALLRHRGVVGQVRTWARHLELVPDDRTVMPSPLFWTFGCALNALVPLLVGSMVVLEETFDAGRFLEDLTRYECTHLQGVPAQYELALKHPDTRRYDLSRLRLIQIGGSTSAEGLARRLLERAPRAALVSAYGLTEAVGVNTYTDLDDPIERVMRTVGHAAGGTEVALFDPETDRPTPVGEVGEICIRGDCVMAGYLDDEAATEQALRGGWLHTGDLAVADDRGYFSIVGRRVDAFKSGGMNVYPAEIEAALGEHPDVQLSAVIGVPHPERGAVGRAFVVPRAGAALDVEALRAFCRGRLAPYKVPAEFVVVGELPMTPTGKVQKFKLRSGPAEWTPSPAGPCP
jgi:fatty-acyl-CoA synthase